MKNTLHSEKMLSLVEQWEQSGETKVQFAKGHEISLHTLNYWLYKRSKQVGGSEGFIKLTPVVSGEISLRYPNGVELHIPAKTSISTISQLISLKV